MDLDRPPLHKSPFLFDLGMLRWYILQLLKGCPLFRDIFLIGHTCVLTRLYVTSISRPTTL